MVGLYEPYVDVCRLLDETWPGKTATKSLLVNSGAEAVENAVKIARVATGRSAVIAFDHAFHRSEERRVGKDCRPRGRRSTSSRGRHTRYIGDWSSDVCSSDLDGRVVRAVRRRVPPPRRDVAGKDRDEVAARQLGRGGGRERGQDRAGRDGPLRGDRVRPRVPQIGRASCRERL